MANYVDLVTTEKKFVSNIVIQIGDDYFATRSPDSGLDLDEPYDSMVTSLTLNNAAIDIKKVNTTIASYTFKLLDKDGIISDIVLGNGINLVGQQVTIWIGRNKTNPVAEDNDFEGYYQLPITRIKKLEHADNTYVFSTSEDTDKIARPIFDATSALAVDILAATTTIQMRDAIDDFPATGYVHIDNEIFSYTSKNDTTRIFSGVIRGEFNTIPDDHQANDSCYASVVITDNPLNLLLRILISNGGDGIYDNLKDGLGIDNELIDVAEFENIRDNLFLGVQIKLELSNIDSALKFIETEILQPFNLRLKYALNAKLSIVILDKAVFSPLIDVIDEDTITSYPKWTVDDSKIVNKLKINWDYDEATGKFLKYTEYVSDNSIDTYDLRNPLSFSFKGIRSALGGTALIEEYARVIFARFATPIAEVSVKTQIDRSLKNIGDKIYLESSKIPSTTGGLQFASDMEVTARAINYQTNEVSFTFSFTSFTKFRSGFIAPSDKITYVQDQHTIGVVLGRAAKYREGFYMRLWNDLTQTYEVDAPNKIIGFAIGNNNVLLDSGFKLILDDGTGGLDYDQAGNDLIIFQNDWTTALTIDHRIRFANYSEVSESQKRYSFISDDGNNFSDGKQTYKVTY